MKTLLAFLVFFAYVLCSFSQTFFQQYFDGADTAAYNSILIQMDADSNNLWQVGPPQKVLFDTAATVPNVMVTDTVQLLSGSNTSIFQFKISTMSWGWGILALQWMQKLDMPHGNVGGMVEFSTDAGQSWENSFNNPFVYNYYGFLAANQDTLWNGKDAFTGQDTTWRDIWLCYDLGWAAVFDTIDIRFTFMADSSTEAYEGWMIDNMMCHVTIAHTLKEGQPDQYLTVYPSVTSDRVHIVVSKIEPSDFIEKIDVLDNLGRIVTSVGPCPTKFWIDLADYAPGNYYLRVKTPQRTETAKVVLAR